MKKTIFTCLVVVALLLPSASFAAFNANFNPEINYQGRLVTSSDTAVADGTYNMRFNLYTSLSGGAPIWTETLTGGNRVQVTNTLFSIMLGSTTPLTSVNFNQPLYLGVEIGGTTVSPSWDGEMAPRKVLGAVPAALVADTLDGLDSTQFVRSDVNSTINANLTINGSATTSAFAITGLSSGLLKTTASGSVVAAVAGTDYIANTSGDWLGTFGGKTSAFYIANSFSTTSANAYLATKNSDNLAEGISNLYFTQNHFDTALAATTTLNNLTTLKGLSDLIVTRSTTTNATTTNLFSMTASSTNLFASLLHVGSNALNVNSNGLIGVGTNNPITALDIHVPDSKLGIRITDDTSGHGIDFQGNTPAINFNEYWDGTQNVAIGNDYTAAINLITDNGGIEFDTGDNPGAGNPVNLQLRMVLDKDGNLGLGNDNPTALLDLGQAGSIPGVIKFAGGSSGNITLQTVASAGTNTITLPATTGTVITSGDTNTVTDAMTVNSLTISGGVINNTPIGATTPSTGVFTNSTSTNATTTNFFATTASTSNLFAASINGAGLSTCNSGSNALTWNGGTFGCNSITSSSASSTLLTDNNAFTGKNTFADLTVIRSTTTNATTTNFFATTASSTNLFYTNAVGGTETLANTLTVNGLATSTFAGSVVVGNSRVFATGTNGGNMAFGFAQPSTGSIISKGIGSLAGGQAADNFGSGESIVSSGDGSVALGYAEDSFGPQGKILSGGAGSFSLGATTGRTISTAGFGTLAGGYASAGDITANTQGSFAWGDNISATANYATAFGTGFANNTANTFKVGYSATPTLTVNSTGVGIGITPNTSFALEVNGTASTTNLFSGLGTFANLLTTGSSTLQKFTFTNATGTNATTTNLFATNFAGTNLSGTAITAGTFGGAGLTSCSGASNALIWSSGLFGCNTVTGGGGGGTDSNWSFFNNSGIRVATTSNQVLIGAVSTSSLSRLQVVGGATFDTATATSATTTNLAITGLATSAGAFLAVDANGRVIATSTPSSSASSTLLSDNNAFTGKNTFTDLTVTRSTTTNATTTNFFASNFINTTSLTGGYQIDGVTILQASTTRNLLAIGPQALQSNTTGQENIAIGNQTLGGNTTGFFNDALGYQALLHNTTGNSNVAFGDQALDFNTTGSQNAAVGIQTLADNITGTKNAAFGAFALENNISATSSTAVGWNAAGGFGFYNAQNLTAIGTNALGSLITGSDDNTALGFNAGQAVSSGSKNLLLGYQAGNNLTTGSSNIVLGYNINTPSVSSSNTLNIGNLLFGTGVDGTGSTLSSGNIGIGLTTPNFKFEVQGTASTTNLYVTNGTTTNATTTNLFANVFTGAGLTNCNGTANAVTWNGGAFGCNTITSPASSDKFATSTNGLVIYANSATSLVLGESATSTPNTTFEVIGGLFADRSTTTSATTTSLFSTTASSTNLFSTNSNLGVITSGLINGQRITSAANFTGSLTASTLISAGSFSAGANATSTLHGGLVVGNTSGLFANAPTSSNNGDLTVGFNTGGGTVDSTGAASLTVGSVQSFISSPAKVLSSGSGSLAVGRAESALASTIISSSGRGSVAFGFASDGNITASGDGSLAGGDALNSNVTATGNGAFAWGNNVNATANYATAFGSGFTNNTASAFQVGYSATPTLTVNATGVGIGTTTPPSRLTIATSTVYSAAFPDLLIGPRGLVSGNSAGTIIGVNTDNFSGDFMNLQNNGTSIFSVDTLGRVSVGNNLFVGTGPSSGNLIMPNGGQIDWAAGTVVDGSTNGQLSMASNIGDFSRLVFGSGSAAFPALGIASTTRSLIVELGNGTNGGTFAVGTSTPRALVTFASSTAPQLTLSDALAGDNAWNFRNAGGNLYIATSSPSTFATSSVSALTINTNGLLTFNALNSTTTNATTTNLFATTATITTASTTNFFGAGLSTCNTGSNALTYNGSGKFGCTTLSSASTTLLTDNNGFTGANSFSTLLATGSSTLQNFTFTNATGTNATTTNLFSTTASSTNLFASLLTVGSNALLVNSSGNVGVSSSTPWAQLSVGVVTGSQSPLFAVGSSTNTALIVDNAGNVGFGTSSPYANFAFQPRATVSASQPYFFAVDGGSKNGSGPLPTGGSILLKAQSITGTSGLNGGGLTLLGGNGSATNGGAGGAISITGGNGLGGGVAGQINLQAGTGGSQFITLNASGGNVGIGTSAPNFSLEINGTASTTNLYATNGTTTNATSTNFFATTASTTNFFGAGLTTCNTGSKALTYNGSGNFGCTTISTASTTLLTDNNGFTGANSFSTILATGSSTLQNFTFTNATGTNATTTNLFATNASTTNLFFTNANGGTETLANTLTVNGLATSTFAGSVAVGDSKVFAAGSAQGNIAFGNSQGLSVDSITSKGIGSLAGGYTTDSGGNGGKILSSGDGSIALGYAESLFFGTGGKITSAGEGSVALGAATDQSILASGIGTLAGGYASAGTITASGPGGAFAWGDNISATAALATAFGTGFTNSTANSFEVGYSATPTLTVNATSTIISGGLSVLGNSTTTNATTTALFATNATITNASTTNFFGAGLSTCNVSSALTYNGAGKFGCTAISGSSASSTLLADNNAFTGANTFATLLATGSSTLQNFTFTNATGTNATTTNLFATTASTTNLFSTNSNLGVVTSGLINGQNISSAANFTGTLTVNAGLSTFSNILATGSTTLQNFTFINATGTSATTTSLFTTNATITNASTTNFFGAGLTTCNTGSKALTYNGSGNFGCTTISSASTTLLTDNNSFTGANTFSTLLLTGSSTLQNFTFVNATGTNATTTNFFATNATFATASSTNLFSTNSNLGVVTAGLVNGQTISSAANFTGTLTATAGLSTFSNILATGSTTLQNFTGINSTTTNATTTSLAISSLATPAGSFLAVNANGTVIATSTPSSAASSTLLADNNTFTGANKFSTLLATGSSTLQGFTFTNATGTNATTTNLFATTASTTNFFGAGLTTCNTGTKALTYNGSGNFGCTTISTASTTLLTDNNSFTGNNTFTNFTATNATTTNATSTLLAVSSQLTVGSGTGAIVGSNGQIINNQNGAAGLILHNSSAGNEVGIFAGASGDGSIGSITNNPFYLQANNTKMAIITPGGFFALGTTTPEWQLELASSTRAQLTLSDATPGDNHWSFRNAGGVLYIATSSPTTFATSTANALMIDANGLLTFNALNSTTTNATTTALFATNATITNASTTNFFGAGLTTCNTSSALTYNGSGKFGCTAISAGSSASSTLLADNNSFTGLNNFSDLTVTRLNVTNSTTTNATTTNFFATTASSTNLFASLVNFGSNAFVVNAAGSVGVGTSTPGRKLNVLDAGSNAQIRLSQSGTVFTELYADASGDLQLSATGGNIRMNDDNLWVCSGGSCGATPPAGSGNIIVENAIKFDNNFSFKNVDASTTAMYDSAANEILQFDEAP